MIKSMDEVKELEGMGKIERQVVIIYKEAVTAGISQLEIPLEEIRAGRSLSARIDLIELNDQVDMDKLIKRIENNPIVLVAEKNATAKTMTEKEGV